MTATPLTDSHDLGRAVRERRKARGLTLVETARQAGVGIRFMSELENGKATVRLDKVLAVIRALDLGLAVVEGPEPAPAMDGTDDPGDVMTEVRGILDAVSGSRSE